jgi:hypothetical protein
MPQVSQSKADLFWLSPFSTAGQTVWDLEIGLCRKEFLQQRQGLLSLFFLESADGESGMYNHVIPYLSLSV